MNLADYKNIWVFIETECGKPKNVGFELINAAKPLAQEKGCELIAVVIGKDIEGVAKDAICYGADSAIIVDGPEYEYYTTDAFAKALVALVEKYKPETLMVFLSIGKKHFFEYCMGRDFEKIAGDTESNINRGMEMAV